MIMWWRSGVAAGDLGRDHEVAVIDFDGDQEVTAQASHHLEMETSRQKFG